jgi:hypothetical protein
MPDDAQIRFRCPHCDRPLRVAPLHAGKRCKCPSCAAVIQVPSLRHEDPREAADVANREEKPPPSPVWTPVRGVVTGKNGDAFFGDFGPGKRGYLGRVCMGDELLLMEDTVSDGGKYGDLIKVKVVTAASETCLGKIGWVNPEKTSFAEQVERAFRSFLARSVDQVQASEESGVKCQETVTQEVLTALVADFLAKWSEKRSRALDEVWRELVSTNSPGEAQSLISNLLGILRVHPEYFSAERLECLVSLSSNKYFERIESANFMCSDYGHDKVYDFATLPEPANAATLRELARDTLARRKIRDEVAAE